MFLSGTFIVQLLVFSTFSSRRYSWSSINHHSQHDAILIVFGNTTTIHIPYVHSEYILQFRFSSLLLWMLAFLTVLKYELLWRAARSYEDEKTGKVAARFIYTISYMLVLVFYERDSKLYFWLQINIRIREQPILWGQERWCFRDLLRWASTKSDPKSGLFRHPVNCGWKWF